MMQVELGIAHAFSSNNGGTSVESDELIISMLGEAKTQSAEQATEAACKMPGCHISGFVVI
jgi:hypothetical protein